MSPRVRLDLPFGMGLDRNTGVMVSDGRTQEDIRNVHLTEGMAFVRRGSVPSAEFTGYDRTLAGQPLKATNIGMQATFDSTTGEVHIWRTAPDGTSPAHVGLWFTLAAAARTPPIIFMAEIAGLMFFAHDEPAVSARAPTVYYDPVAGSLHALVSSWAHATTIVGGGSNSSIRFWPVAVLGTGITIRYVNPGTPGASLSVTVSSAAITVNLATDGGSAITSTAAEILAAIQASASASALVGSALPGDEDGSGVVAAVSSTSIPDTSGIRFRGVTEHLGAYLIGWGYGTEGEAHPEYVRASLPNDPTTFELQHYAIIGQEGDAVRGCASTGPTLVCYKAFETWEHFGTDRSTFGIRQIDKNVGLLGSRAMIVVDGVCFAWSHLGPRASDGSRVEDISLPLAVFAPAPADLPTEGDSVQSFAAYVPKRRDVRFHFGKRFYAYNLRTQQWSYGEMAFEPTCAMLLPGGTGETQTIGYTDALSVTADIETP